MKDELERKTETIKDRAIYVYLPSLETALNWKKGLRRAGFLFPSLSSRGLRLAPKREWREGDLRQQAELAKKYMDSEEELEKMRNENRLLERLADNLDKQ